MKINDLKYVDEFSNFALYGGPHDPYTGETNDSIGKKLWYCASLDMQWNVVNKKNEDITIKLNAGRIGTAVLNVEATYLVVEFAKSDKWPWPSNAGAFNADGSIRGKITPPTGVTPQPIEGIAGVQMKDEKIVIRCYYNYDRLVYIEFNPETMQWGRVVHLGGRA